jgi:hypothetical protein
VADALPEALVDYFAKRRADRAQVVDDFLAKLTPREKALITQAAVMGWVQGVRHHDAERIPKNTPLLAHVIDACFSFPDLYPAVTVFARYTVDVQDNVEYAIECQQPDGSWVQACGTRDTLTAANEEADRQREHRPGYVFRVVQRQTSVFVYTLPEPDEGEEEE